MRKRSLCLCFVILPCVLGAEIPYLLAQAISSAFYSQFNIFQIQSRSLFARNGELRERVLENGVWLNEEFGALTHREREYVTQIDTPYNYFALGSDTSFALPQATLYFGGDLAFTTAPSQSTLVDMKKEAYALGGYFSYIHNNRFFFDVHLKYFYKRDSVFFKQDALRNPLYDEGKHNFYLGFDIGQRLRSSRELGLSFFFFEPSFLLATGYLPRQEFTFRNDLMAKMRGFFPLTLKSNLAFGREWNARYKGSLKGGVSLEYDHQINGAISLEEGKDFLIYLKGQSDFRLSLFLEADFILNQNLRFFLRSHRSFSGKVDRSYALALGIRFSFAPFFTHGLHYKKSIDWMDEERQ